MRLVYLSLVFSLAFAIGSRVDDDVETRSSPVQSQITIPRNGKGQYRARVDRLSRQEKKALAQQEAMKYLELRKQGLDVVSNTEEAAALRNYWLRRKKRMWILLSKKEVSISSQMFPGVPPKEYQPRDSIEIYTDLVASVKVPIPFNFNDDLPVCSGRPSSQLKPSGWSNRRALGAKLLGHNPRPSPFSLVVKEDKGCTPICVVSIGEEKMDGLRELVQKEYRVQLTLDDLPVLVRNPGRNSVIQGYPVGFTLDSSSAKGDNDDNVYINNHLSFTITYREDPSYFFGLRITGFDVQPASIRHNITSEDTFLSTCEQPGDLDVVRGDPLTYLNLRSAGDGMALQVVYSYEVKWVSSDLPWADRWDVYMLNTLPFDDLYFIDIVDYLMMTLLITALILIRVFRNRLLAAAKDKKLQPLLLEPLLEPKVAEEHSWKDLHGDVFRAPSFSPMLLSVMVGSGAQVGAFFFFFAIAMQESPLNYVVDKRSTFVTRALVVAAFSGVAAGYVSARLYYYFDGEAPKRNAVCTAIALPSASLLMFTSIYFSLSSHGAVNANSFQPLLGLYALWAIVFCPLSIWGSYLARVVEKRGVPTKTNELVRDIPKLPCYCHPLFTAALGGILPFTVVHVELTRILSAFWLQHIYYTIYKLLAVFCILTVTCAQVAIIMCYWQLNRQDHRWWDKSFWNCASAGVYVMFDAIWFLKTRLNLDGTFSVTMYLAYASMIAVSFGLYCGAIGVLASFGFSRIIYATVKSVN